MTFLVVASLLVLLRVAWSLVLPWRMLSVSTTNLAGTIFFVALGLQYMPLTSPIEGALYVVMFYQFLLIGEFLGKIVYVDRQGLALIGEWFASSRTMYTGLFIVFCVFCLLPLASLIASGRSLTSAVVTTWSGDAVASRAAAVMDTVNFRSISGVAALVVGIQQQLIGFWYLSIGVLYPRYPRITLFGLLIYVVGVFVSSSGARSSIFIGVGIMAVLWLLSRVQGRRKRLKLSHITFAILLGLASLVALDFLLVARTGASQQGGVTTRISRALENDFAYGGLGIDFASNTRPATLETGTDYVLRLLAGPIPRVLWPEKSTVDANLEMTSYFLNRPIEAINSIRLFTPLGEALFYFGYIGFVIIPLLYGFVTAWLERVYSTSTSYWGLLSQVYVWSFLAMRQTFYNLWFALVVANFLLLLFLFVFKWVFRPSQRRHREFNHLPQNASKPASVLIESSAAGPERN